MMQNVFIRNVSWRFYAKSKFCICFEVHIPVLQHITLFSAVSQKLDVALVTQLLFNELYFEKLIF